MNVCLQEAASLHQIAPPVSIIHLLQLEPTRRVKFLSRQVAECLKDSNESQDFTKIIPKGGGAILLNISSFPTPPFLSKQEWLVVNAGTSGNVSCYD